MSRFPLGQDPDNPRKHQYWPDDMSDVLSVMSPIPNPALWGDLPPITQHWEGMDSFLADWETDLRESFGPVLGDSLNDVEFNYYLRPPAAGPYVDFIYTLAENINWIVQNTGNYIALGGALVSFAKSRRSRLNPDTSPNVFRSEQTYFYTTARGIEAMCLYHAVQTYDLGNGESRLQISSTSRKIFNGSVSHPLPGVTFTVSIRSGDLRYVYVVDANARVSEHFVVEPNQIRGLPLPDWFDEQQDWDVFVSTDLPSLDLGPVSTEPH